MVVPFQTVFACFAATRVAMESHGLTQDISYLLEDSDTLMGHLIACMMQTYHTSIGSDVNKNVRDTMKFPFDTEPVDYSAIYSFFNVSQDLCAGPDADYTMLMAYLESHDDLLALYRERFGNLDNANSELQYERVRERKHEQHNNEL